MKNFEEFEEQNRTQLQKDYCAYNKTDYLMYAKEIYLSIIEEE